MSSIFAVHDDEHLVDGEHEHLVDGDGAALLEEVSDRQQGGHRGQLRMAYRLAERYTHRLLFVPRLAGTPGTVTVGPRTRRAPRPEPS